QVPDDVTFMVAVPKPTAANGYKQPPYPCVVFGHGIDRCRIDGLSIASRRARLGYATIGIDVYGHGPDGTLSHLPQYLAGLGAGSTTNDIAVRAALESLAALTGPLVNPLDPLDVMAKNVLSRGIFAPLVTEGRAIDCDGDGYPDGGQCFFGADATATRDMMRQTALDTVQLLRILRACGTDVNKNGVIDPEEGDFGKTGKGVSDVGGPGATIHYVGQSLGTMIGSEVLALAPEIDSAVLNVAGSDLFHDVHALGGFHVVTDRFPTHTWGVALSGRFDPSAGSVAVSVQVEGAAPPVAHLAVVPGSAVTLTNLAAGVAATA